MPILRILLLVLAATLASAQATDPSAPPPPPAAADIAQRAASLEALRPRYLNDKGEPTDAGALARLDDAIARLRVVTDLREEARSLAADTDAAPAQIAAFQTELDTPLPAPESLLPGADADVSMLEAAQAQIGERLQAVRTRLEGIGKQRAERAARAESIPAELAAARAALDETEDRLAASTGAEAGADGDIANARRLIDEAIQLHARALIDKLEAERRFITAVAPRNELRQKLADREAAQLAKLQEQVVARIADARQRAAARQQAETRRAADEVPPELQRLRDRTLALTRENSRLVDRLNAIEAHLGATRAQAQTVAARDAEIKSRAAASPGGIQIGQLLQRAKDSLPDPDALRGEAARAVREASTLDDRAFELQTLLDEAPQSPEAVRASLRRELNLDEPTETQIAAASDLIARQSQTARDLLDLINGPGRLIAQAHELAAAKTDLAIRVEDLERFIDARILWIRSDPAITRVSPRAALRGVQTLIDPAQWSALWTAARDRPVFLVTSAIAIPALAVLLFAWQLGIHRRLARVNQRVQMPATDRFWLTLVAIGLVLLLAAPIPLGLAAVARLFLTFSSPELPIATWVGVGLQRAVAAVFVGASLIGLTLPGGVGETHFRWPKASTAAVRRHLLWYTPTLAVIGATLTGARAVADPDALVFSRYLVLVGFALSASFFALLLRPHGPLMRNVVETSIWRGWRYTWPILYIAVVGSFLALGVLHALGWSFSARALAGCLFDSALVVAVLVLARAVLLRWMSIARRRLAFEQHRKLLESMAQQERQGESAESPAIQRGDEDDMIAAPPAAPQLDLISIQRQTRQLVALGVWTLGVLMVLPIWRDVFPALERIDEIRLLPISVADHESTATLRDAGRYVLSLGDVLGALLVVFVGAMAVRNVPPLFDGFVLSRTRLDIGARYAATTLARYGLLALVAFLFLNSVGFTGKSLGWAIAGLSVGLGLGLQEFVGNLVAGLSLLFERSVRPGDRIAVGPIEGVVKTMSIRATILSDWDRRDVVIPNRKLIADIVINETRTDLTSRAIIKIGVAYGADTRLVERLLIDTVRRHPHVEDVICTFDAFGDNALNFTLRIYITDVGQRLAIVNELHHTINEAFRARNIEISFPQRDLHIRDGSLDVRIVDTRLTGDTAPSA